MTPSDEPHTEMKMKEFRFGGEDTEGVTLPAEDANISDAIDAYAGLKEAQRTAQLPGNGGFVKALEEALRDGEERLRRAVALSVLSGALKALRGAVRRAAEDDDPAPLKGSALFGQKNGEVTAEGLGDRLEAWREEPPPFFLSVAEDVLEKGDESRWEGWAEWAATHVLYWAREDVNEQIREEGRSPEDVPDEEWDARFSDQLTVETYFWDAVEILASELGTTVAESVFETAQDEALSVVQIERLFGLHEDDPHEDDAAAPRPSPSPETPDYDPDPFTGENNTAGLLAGPFSNAVTGSIMEADGEPAKSNQGEWGQGPGGGPVRVEKLKTPYEGRAVLKVQAAAGADPAEVEAAMGWEMLGRMDMDTVWLHLLLLGHASAPHRDGWDTITIPRKRIENALGLRNGDNYTVAQRAEEVERHVRALQSIYVKFRGVRRHGEVTRLTNSRNPTPLWNIQMVEHADLFEDSVRKDWVLKVKEGIWGEEFLQDWEAPQWTPLPKQWFDQIDRRGKDWTQRLAVALLFLFRINAKRGGKVKLRAEKMLEICGTDLSGSSRRGTERKRRLSKALDSLSHNYKIDVRADRVHMDNTAGISHSKWKTRVATFYPPKDISGELFRNESDGRPPLPEVKGGDWTAGQIKQLRSDLGDTQAEFSGRVGVSRQMISRYENNHDPPSNRVCKILDRLHSRFR